MFSVEKLSTCENENELRLVIDNLPSMIAYVDSSKRYRVINRAYHNYFDANENEVIGKHASEVLGNRFYSNIKKYINVALAGKSTGWETYHLDSTGKGCILSVKLVPYINSNHKNDGYLVVVEDVTKEKQLQLQLEMLNQSLEEKVNSRTRQLQKELLKRKILEKRLRYLADYDPLTGLLNRRSFAKRVDYEIKRCHRYKSDLSYLIIDIDKFKVINDTYGHLTGDAVLKAFSEKITGILRETDFIGRIGGEEFAVVLPGTSIHAANEMGERIREIIAEHIVCYNNVNINYTVSIGVSVFELKEECMEDVFNRADSALYQAKNTGRNKVCVYT